MNEDESEERNEEGVPFGVVKERHVALVVGEEAFETDDAFFFGVISHTSQL
jgi:hypothetical protein